VPGLCHRGDPGPDTRFRPINHVELDLRVCPLSRTPVATLPGREDGAHEVQVRRHRPSLAYRASCRPCQPWAWQGYSSSLSKCLVARTRRLALCASIRAHRRTPLTLVHRRCSSAPAEGSHTSAYWRDAAVPGSTRASAPARPKRRVRLPRARSAAEAVTGVQMQHPRRDAAPHFVPRLSEREFHDTPRVRESGREASVRSTSAGDEAREGDAPAS
jgi:hypothetical protein